MTTMHLRSGKVNEENGDNFAVAVKVAKPRIPLNALQNNLNQLSIRTEPQQKEDAAAPGRVLHQVPADPAPEADAPIAQEESDVDQSDESREEVNNNPKDEMSVMETPERSVVIPEGIEDIDRNDSDNPQLVNLYIKEIYIYLQMQEEKHAIRRSYLNEAQHRSITGRMRAVLVDWLFQVHLRFHLLQETMYLAVAAMDMYLQENKCTRSELQLVGVTSLLIASKYEEMYSPEVQDFVYITDSAYTKQQILQMESRVLSALRFELGRPLPLHFLRRFSKVWEVDAQKHTLAKYLMMLAQTEYALVHIAPSQLAAAALCLSALLLTNTHWDRTMRYYTCYHEDTLRPVMRLLARLAQQNYLGKAKQKAVRTHFSISRHMNVSQLPVLDSEVVRDLVAEL